MGLFDTIMFPKPIACKKCGKLHESTQTKQFENLMVTYSIGDIIPGNVMSGVIKETIFCDHGDIENKENYSFDQPIFLVIWHNILTEIVEKLEEAENKLSKFSLGDLYILYRNLYLEKINYQVKYERLKNQTRILFEYLELPPEKQEKIRKGKNNTFDNIRYLRIIEHLDKKNPIEEIIQNLDGQKFTEKLIF